MGFLDDVGCGMFVVRGAEGVREFVASVWFQISCLHESQWHFAARCSSRLRFVVVFIALHLEGILAQSGRDA